MPSLCEIDVCEQPQQSCRIAPRNFDLSRCGIPQVPSNARYIDLYMAVFYQQVLVDGQVLLDEKVSFDDNADVYLYNIRPVISSDDSGDYFARFQWPNGRYSSNARQDIRTWKGTITPNVIRIPAGQKMGVELEYGVGEDDKNVVIAFEVVKRFYLL